MQAQAVIQTASELGKRATKLKGLLRKRAAIEKSLVRLDAKIASVAAGEAPAPRKTRKK